MAWTNLVAALAVGALAAYVLLRARSLADDERAVFQFGARFFRWRLVDHWISGVFLALVAIALLIGGIR